MLSSAINTSLKMHHGLKKIHHGQIKNLISWKIPTTLSPTLLINEKDERINPVFKDTSMLLSK